LEYYVRDVLIKRQGIIGDESCELVKVLISLEGLWSKNPRGLWKSLCRSIQFNAQSAKT